MLILSRKCCYRDELISSARACCINTVHRVTSVRYGIQTASPPFFGGTGPDFVVSGPNVGNNLGSVVLESGTV